MKGDKKLRAKELAGQVGQGSRGKDAVSGEVVLVAGGEDG